MTLETERLASRPFELTDAPFILELVNTPAWLQFIGDRNVHSIKDAENYLLNGPIKSYTENGFGLSCVLLKENNLPIGMCGLIKRNGLDNPDIGFSFLPGYPGKGYGYEIASATLKYGDEILKFKMVDAITNDNNVASIALLKKLEFSFKEKIKLPGSEEELLLFRINLEEKKLKTLDDITDRFYACFKNKQNIQPNVDYLKEIFIPEACIVRNINPQTEIYSFQRFIQPRIKILTDGTLIEFEEKEITSETKIFGNIAQRFSYYKKSGILNGKSFENSGFKSFHFIKTSGGWKISSLIWDDQP